MQSVLEIKLPLICIPCLIWYGLQIYNFQCFHMTLLGWEKILATWFLTESAWSHHMFEFLLDINPLSYKLFCSHGIPTKQLQMIRATLHNLLWSIFETGLTRWCALFFLSFPLSLSLSAAACSYRKVCGLQMPMWYMCSLWTDCLYLTVNVLMFALLEIMGISPTHREIWNCWNQTGRNHCN